MPSIDTLKTARALESSGFTRQQAEGWVEAISVTVMEIRAASAGEIAPDGPLFDAPALVGRLIAAGFTETRAATMAEALADALVRVP